MINLQDQQWRQAWTMLLASAVKGKMIDTSTTSHWLHD